MRLAAFMRSAQMNKRYLYIPKYQLLRPLLVIWGVWFFLSLLPTLMYISLMLPITMLCSIVIVKWFAIWECFGCSKTAYIAINIFVPVAERIIGMLVQDRLLDLLLDWRILYGF